jgi:23S rRNA (cytosine1962-C5)-methyltransferase
VLNLFAYTGGFSAAAVAGGADIIVSVDDSNAALSWCERNVALSRPGANHRAKAADVFDAMASFERSREQFDLVVVDPPSYSTTHTRRFRVIDDLVELVAAAMRITSVRGRLLISVNHRAITENALRRGIFTAARSIGRTIVNIKDLPPQSDFPFQQDEAFGSKSALAVLA